MIVLTILWYYFLIGSSVTFYSSLNVTNNQILFQYLNSVTFKELGIENNEGQQKWFIFVMLVLQMIYWPIYIFKNKGQ